VTLSTSDFEFVRELVHRRAAIVLESNKEYLALSRLEPVARSVGLDTVTELIATLRNEPNSPLHEQVVEAMTTNETSFFRDLYPFESLRTHVLPAVLEQNRASRCINIWSAACSSGQEPYSVAMLLHEDFPELDSWFVNILATDVSAAILERARNGRFAQIEMNRGLPAHLHVKYFHRDGSHWVIDESIRNRVRFERHNLVTEWPTLPAMDIVFLRNVLIYFDQTTKDAIFQRMKRVVRPNGYLLLGASETTLNLDNEFERQPLGRTVWYRKKARAFSIDTPGG
jgi:chemotaxis protein methyltransferase CheR